MPLPLAGFIASRAGSKLLLNTALAAAFGLLAEEVPADEEEKDLKGKAAGVAQSTAVGTAVAAVLGPNAALGKEIAASLLANTAIQKVTHADTPGSDALDFIKQIATDKEQRIAKQKANKEKLDKILQFHSSGSHKEFSITIPEVPPLPNGYPYNNSLFLAYYKQALDAWYAFVADVTTAQEDVES